MPGVTEDDDVQKLIDRIEALEALCACYRTETRPDAKLLKRLHETRNAVFPIRARAVR